jgi:hypothetical protein
MLSTVGSRYEPVSLETLKKVKVKRLPGAKNWAGVPHSEVVDTAVGVLEGLGLTPKTTWWLGPKKTLLFGALDLPLEVKFGQPVTVSLALRQGNGGEYALSFMIGVRVECCGNGVWYSEPTGPHRRHVLGFKLEAHVRTCVEACLDSVPAMTEYFESMSGSWMTGDEACRFMFSAFERKALGFRYLEDVWQFYKAPTHEEFLPESPWRLLNAFSEVAKRKFSPQAQILMWKAMESLT